ncbi:protease, partial [Streptomyces sp. XM83C]|nr:protease [Streptomyces sp. XM83C]
MSTENEGTAVPQAPSAPPVPVASPATPSQQTDAGPEPASRPTPEQPYDQQTAPTPTGADRPQQPDASPYAGVPGGCGGGQRLGRAVP